MKTIKEIADSLGVSKTAVRKYLTEDFRKKYVQTTANGTLKVSDKGAKLLQTFIKKPQTTENQASDDVIKCLIAQLEEKDKQIAALTAALENTTASLNAAQALHAADKQQFLQSSDEKDRNGLFGFFKRKK